MAHPPTFFVNSEAGCIGRFWWLNTIQRPEGWICDSWPFPLWGTSHWYPLLPQRTTQP